MASLNLLALFTGLAAVTSAFPALDAAVPVNAKFRISQKSVGVTNLAYGPVAMVNDLVKYGKTPPQYLLDAAQTAVNSGSVQANPGKYDAQYLAEVTVGSNNLTMDFDTGSSDFWVFSTLLPKKQRRGHAVYHPNPADKVAGQSWNITYGDGSTAAGYVYADKVTIAGVTATGQDVEAATTVASEFVNVKANDGLVGLAFPQLNQCQPNKCQTFMENVGPTLSQNLFAAALRKGEPGYYDFGFIDTSKYTGKISYQQITAGSGFWIFPLLGVRLNGTTLHGSVPTIMDTGTSLIYVGDSLLSRYYGAVQGATDDQSLGGWVFPCNATLPDIAFQFGGQFQTVPGEYINYSPATTDGAMCYGGMQSSSGLGVDILGDVFIKSKYVIFDVANYQIGVAEQS